MNDVKKAKRFVLRRYPKAFSGDVSGGEGIVGFNKVMGKDGR